MTNPVIERLRELSDALQRGDWLTEKAHGEVENALPVLLDVVEAARDPFLVLLESHPKADPPANAEMRRAADRLRSALQALDSGEADD